MSGTKSDSVDSPAGGSRERRLGERLCLPRIALVPWWRNLSDVFTEKTIAESYFRDVYRTVHKSQCRNGFDDIYMDFHIIVYILPGVCVTAILEFSVNCMNIFIHTRVVCDASSCIRLISAAGVSFSSSGVLSPAPAMINQIIVRDSRLTILRSIPVGFPESETHRGLVSDRMWDVSGLGYEVVKQTACGRGEYRSEERLWLAGKRKLVYQHPFSGLEWKMGYIERRQRVLEVSRRN